MAARHGGPAGGSGSGGNAWPTSVRVGGLEVALGKRAVNMDPVDAAECDDATLTAPDTIIGSLETGATVEWSQGPVAATAPSMMRQAVSADAAEAAVAAGALVFLRRGNNYRLYGGSGPSLSGTSESQKMMAASAASPAGLSAAALESTTDADLSPSADPATASDAADASGENLGGKAKKQYTKAVAFEFVSGVLSNVLGADEAQAAWAA